MSKVLRQDEATKKDVNGSETVGGEFRVAVLDLPVFPQFTKVVLGKDQAYIWLNIKQSSITLATLED